MPDEQPKQQFNVHIFAVVRVMVPGVDAVSQREAISKTLASTDLHAQFIDTDCEYAEELAYFAVDVVGDDEFSQTRWYDNRETPHLTYLARLIQWYDNGRPEDELQQVIRDAREVLANSV